jgi:hypothetical protein
LRIFNAEQKAAEKAAEKMEKKTGTGVSYVNKPNYNSFNQKTIIMADAKLALLLKETQPKARQDC